MLNVGWAVWERSELPADMRLRCFWADWAEGFNPVGFCSMMVEVKKTFMLYMQAYEVISASQYK